MFVKVLFVFFSSLFFQGELFIHVLQSTSNNGVLIQLNRFPKIAHTKTFLLPVLLMASNLDSR